MPESITEAARLSLVIEIGATPVRIHTTDPDFLGMLQERYAGFITTALSPAIEVDIDLRPPQAAHPEGAGPLIPITTLF